MLSKTSTVLSTLHGVQGFMTTHADALGSLNTSASREDLDAVEAQLSTHAATQAQSRYGSASAVTRNRVVRNALQVNYLRPISAIAEAKLASSPDLGTLRLPKNVRTTPQLLAAAEAMGQAAAKYAETFIAAGMAPTFLDDLHAAANAVKEAEATKGSVKSSRMGATKALRVYTEEANRVVRQLDALIEPALAGNPALLMKWKATKRFSAKTPAISAVSTDAATAGSAPSATGETSAPNLVSVVAA